jgi:hypothetical protein
MHSVPRELLDILMFLPFMKKDGIIVLHDTSFQHLQNTSYSNGVLFSVIKANKLQPLTICCSDFPLPNIGAFQLREDMMDNIGDIFLSLNLIWHYLPNECDMESAFTLYNKYYDEKDINILRNIYNINRYKFRENIEKNRKYFKLFVHLLYFFVFKKKNRKRMRKKYI